MYLDPLGSTGGTWASGLAALGSEHWMLGGLMSDLSCAIHGFDNGRGEHLATQAPKCKAP